MKKWLLIIIPVLIVAGLIIWRLGQKQGQNARPAGAGRAAASVEIVTPQLRTIQKTYQATGNVESMQNVIISPKVTGRIEYLQVRQGDTVKENQVLVRIDQSQIQTEVRQQQGNLAEAKYRLAQAQLNQLPTNTAISTQIRQQQANLTSMQADQIQTEKTRAAQDESSKASIEDAQSKIDNANATVSNANAQLKSAQANLENATTKYNRLASLYQQGYIAAQDVDDAKTEMNVQQSVVETAQGQVQSAGAALKSAMAQKRSAVQQAAITQAKSDADIAAAQARVAQAKASLESAQANAQQSPAFQQNIEALRASVAVAKASLDSTMSKLADTVLRSPMDGVITARSQDPGALASAGQPILTVQSLNHIWLTISVPEEVCQNIHLTQSANVTFDALGSDVFIGKIAQINPSADLTSRQFTIYIVLDNAKHRFTPGMFAKVTIVTAQALNALAVPLEAIDQDTDNSSYVMVAGDDKKAHKRPVITGVSDANWTAILAGLTMKEKVITMSAMPLRDGQSIQSGRRGGRGGRTGNNAGQPNPVAGAAESSANPPAPVAPGQIKPSRPATEATTASEKPSAPRKQRPARN